MLQQIEPMASSIALDTFEALTLLVQVKTKPLGEKFAITLPDLSGNPVKISATDTPKARWWHRR